MKNEKEKNTSGAPTPSLTSAVKQLLRPLVGLMLDNGLTYSWLTKILKIIYVDVAETEFGLANKPQTDSRISLITGVHRKDVRRFRNEPAEQFEPPSSIFIGAQLVAIWTTEPNFLNESGKPSPLTRIPSAAAEAGSVSFEALVTLVNKDIRPRAILDEWLRLGVVSINAHDQVCLEVGAFVPAKGFDEKAYYLGKNIHDHMAAARSNVQSEHSPFMERSVYYDNLSERSVEELARLSESKGMELLKLINKKARQLQLRDKKAQSTSERMNFGMYFYSDEDR